MARKAVAMQYVGVVHTRPVGTTDGTTGLGQFASANDTGVVTRIGSYNRPAGPGDTVFTSEIECARACMAVNRLEQERLGLNTRYTVYGKPCGTPPAGNRLSVGDANTTGRAMTTDELAEKVYIDGDTISAGLKDVLKYVNSVPSQSQAIVIRSEEGPETMPTDGEAASGA